MKRGNEQKTTLVQRLLTAALKLTNERHEHRSTSPVEQLNYGLPKSFLTAVDNGRLEAGYDILPRHRDQSAPPSTNKEPSSPSSSSNDIDDDELKKIPFRRRPPRQQQQQPRTIKPTWSSTPRPALRPMVHPSSVMFNRPPRPVLVMRMPPITRPRLFSHPQRMFRPRFH